MKDKILCVHVVVETLNLEISRGNVLNACRTCNTISFSRSASEICFVASSLQLPSSLSSYSLNSLVSSIPLIFRKKDIGRRLDPRGRSHFVLYQLWASLTKIRSDCTKRSYCRQEIRTTLSMGETTTWHIQTKTSSISYNTQ